MSEYMEQINDLASQIMRGENPEAFGQLLDETERKVKDASRRRKPKGGKVKKPLRTEHYKKQGKRWNVEDMTEIVYSDEGYENNAKLAKRLNRTPGSVNKMKSRIMRHVAYHLGMAHDQIAKLNRRSMKIDKEGRTVFMALVDQFSNRHDGDGKEEMKKLLGEVKLRQQQHKPERYKEDSK